MTGELFDPVCVVVDKLDKLTPEQVKAELLALNLSEDIIGVITKTLGIKDLDELASQLGEDSPIVQEFRQLWRLAKAYGYDDFLIFDASVVRGLAYYTGIVFEGFDRRGKFRAICGGGRYDKLLTRFGSKEQVPCAGFGFGDCVIVELLKDLKLLPELPAEVDDIVVAFDEDLRDAATEIATKLRCRGRRTEIQLIPKRKLAQSYSYADRIGADRCILVAPDEYAKGLVKIKSLKLAQDAEKKEIEIPIADL